MYSSAYTPPRRGHRKRLSALRLSSDSTVTTLPVYTSPPRTRLPDLPDIPAEQPPAYSDSAEEADEDTDQSDSDNFFVPSPPPSLPVSPRPSASTRRSRTSASSSSFSSSSRGHRRNHSLANLNANDPYLDSLLARSVHALEMSNALLQSSMSTQTSLSAVLADDAVADRSLERRAQALTSRIQSNRDLHDSWLQDLDSISRGVEGLVRGEDDDSAVDERLNDDEDHRARLPPPEPISQSLPTGGLSERIQRRQGRRASQDFRQASSSSGASLQLSAHDRSAFIAPAPRAITMYVDSSEAADAIALPSTLGVRPTSRPPPTPLPAQTSFSAARTSEPEPPPPAAEEPSRRVVDMLASFVMPRPGAATTSNSASSVSSSPSSSSVLRRRDSSSSSMTIKRHRPSKSPPPALQIDTPSMSASTSSASGSSLRSRSLTPSRGSPVVRQPRPLTPPIEELSTSSTSSDSHTLHVDRTVESLRQILERQQQRAAATTSSKASSTTAPTLPRPALLSPPAVAPTSGTSNATASVSRLFTKARHTTSTRPPSPPKQSSMKGRSAPSTPITSATPTIPASPHPAPSPSPSLLNVPDVFGGMFAGARSRPPSSGASTPKRISFAEPLEPYSSSRAGRDGASGSSSMGPSAFARFRFRSSGGDGDKARGRSTATRARRKGKGKARARSTDGADQGGSGSDEEKAGWWASWLLGTGSGSGARARSEERYGTVSRGAAGMSAGLGVGTGAWAMRPGFGSSLEEWGA
ncbi:hypothetical protein C8Q73DRAFT_326195 [Cubamyces lactineus]|nr:hypothetical protein C8Q73DRAFT_326195 [Cubamyces lactineus]